MQKIALYRKYRPDNFDSLIGQDHIIRVLKNAIKEGKISHAYIFSGPRGTGKTSVARILAKAINCQKRTGYNPCGKCSICVGISENRVMDLIEIDAASNRGIDEIRDLREKVKFSPTEGEYKVFIIDEVHMLTKEAFNALLKTLEEPPEHAIFILATTEINKVPATIISRCQRHDFKRIKLADIVSKLDEIRKEEKINISGEAIELIAESSEGGLRDAISLLDQLGSVGLAKVEENDVENILGLAPHKTVVQFITKLAAGENKEALNILEQASIGGVDIVIFSKSSSDFLRKILMAKLGSETNIEGSKEQIEEIKKIADESDLDRLVKLSDEFIWAQSTFRTNVDPKLILTLICARSGKEDDNMIEVVVEEKEIVSQDKEGGSKREAPSKAPIDLKPNGKWQHLLLEVKAKNNTLYACLRVAVPEFESDGTVKLTFPYKFHKERVEESKNKHLVEELLIKIYGQELPIRCEIAGNGQINNNVSDVDTAASILGGKVVD